MYQVSAPLWPIIALKLSPSTQKGQRATGILGLLGAFKAVMD
jgi:hypothetical protein